MKIVRPAGKLLVLLLAVCIMCGLLPTVNAAQALSFSVGNHNTNITVENWSESIDGIVFESGAVTEITDTQVTVALVFSHSVKLSSPKQIVIAHSCPNGDCDATDAFGNKIWQTHEAISISAVDGDADGYCPVWYATFKRCPADSEHADPWRQAPYTVPANTYVWLTEEDFSTACCLTDGRDQLLSSDVSLETDMTVKNLTVPHDATLDLNGKTLTVLESLVVFGEIKDSSEGGGGIVLAQERAGSEHLLLMPSNSAMPVYDKAYGGYRLFSYTVTHATKPSAYEVKYGVHLEFASTKAYDLLVKPENADVSMTFGLVLNDKQSMPIQVPSWLLTKYAKSMQKDPTKNYVIALKVYGFENMSNFVSLDATPSFISSIGVRATGVTKAYHVNSGAAADARAWLLEQVENDALFSFTGSETWFADASFPTKWTKEFTDNGDNSWTLAYTLNDASNGTFKAWADITLDEEMAALSWTVHIRKDKDASGIFQTNPSFSYIRPLSSTLSIENAQLTTAYGSKAGIGDFQPVFIDLTETSSFSMPTGLINPAWTNNKETGGRSSDIAFPYFEVSNGTRGIMGAIGWTGEWKAGFDYANNVVSMYAGFSDSTNITLNVGEEIRTPSITLQFYNGDSDTGHNNFRDLILKSYTPKDANGQIVEIPKFVSVFPESEQAVIDNLESYKAKGYDFTGLWIDATWFGNVNTYQDWSDGVWESEVGNWYLNQTRFPNGNIDQISAYLEENDMDLLLWLEPERAMAGTRMATEHPEYYISIDGSNKLLFDFSNDEARDFMIEFVDDFIKEYNVSWYRHDCNISPKAYWTARDTALGRRSGTTEIKYITNLYHFFDELLERNPGLVIDNCASGGRRLDIEMMSRSLPLWRTDTSTKADKPQLSHVDGKRSINFNLTWWLPIHDGGYPWCGNGDPNGDGISEDYSDFTYNMRAYMGAPGVVSSGILNQSDKLLSVLEQQRFCKQFMFDEYYMLSYGVWYDLQYIHEPKDMYQTNAAYQFYDSEKDGGYLVTFCPLEGTKLTDTYYLRGLNPNTVYQVNHVDTGVSVMKTGHELMTEGVTITYPSAGSTRMVYILAQ